MCWPRARGAPWRSRSRRGSTAMGDGWRGAASTCDFDLGFHADRVKELVERLDSEAVVLVDLPAGWSTRTSSTTDRPRRAHRECRTVLHAGRAGLCGPACGCAAGEAFADVLAPRQAPALYARPPGGSDRRDAVSALRRHCPERHSRRRFRTGRSCGSAGRRMPEWQLAGAAAERSAAV